MYKEVYKQIKKYDSIVIARHVGPDPDAMASTMALKDSIILTFKDKKVYSVGSGSNRFIYFGRLDKFENLQTLTESPIDTSNWKPRFKGMDVFT